MGKIENLDVNISAAKGYWVKILVSGDAESRRKLKFQNWAFLI